MTPSPRTFVPLRLALAAALSVGIVAPLVVATTSASAVQAVAEARILGPELVNGATLEMGAELTSPNGKYRLVNQTDGNIVIYNSQDVAQWATGSTGNPGTRLVMQTDGNLVAYNRSDTVVYATNTATDGTAGKATRARLTDAGVLELVRISTVVWSSHKPTPEQPDPTTTPAPAVKDTLSANQELLPGEQLVSLNGNYRFVFQEDGNGVLYDQAEEAIWDTKTDGQNAARFVMQADGNVVIYDLDDQPLWETKTDGKGGVRFTVDNIGRVALYGPNSRLIWSSATSTPTATASSTTTTRPVPTTSRPVPTSTRPVPTTNRPTNTTRPVPPPSSTNRPTTRPVPSDTVTRPVPPPRPTRPAPSPTRTTVRP